MSVQLRKIACGCFVLAVPSVSLTSEHKSAFFLALASVVMLLLFSPFRSVTEKGWSVKTLVAVTLSTLLAPFFGAQPLLLTFNTVFLDRLAQRSAKLLPVALFFSLAVALLYFAKILLASHTSGPLRITMMLYPGGVMLLAGLFLLPIRSNE